MRGILAKGGHLRSIMIVLRAAALFWALALQTLDRLSELMADLVRDVWRSLPRPAAIRRRAAAAWAGWRTPQHVVERKDGKTGGRRALRAGAGRRRGRRGRSVFRNRFWERLMVNVGIVLVFWAFYLRFLQQ